MAFAVPFIVGAASAAASAVAASSTAIGVAGAVATGASLLSQPKIPKAGTSPTVPNPADSLVKAKNEADARRSVALKSGGLINPTGGGGSLLGSANVEKKKLFGE